VERLPAKLNDCFGDCWELWKIVVSGCGHDFNQQVASAACREKEGLPRSDGHFGGRSDQAVRDGRLTCLEVISVIKGQQDLSSGWTVLKATSESWILAFHQTAVKGVANGIGLLVSGTALETVARWSGGLNCKGIISVIVAEFEQPCSGF
jgi:hypothetical protein